LSLGGNSNRRPSQALQLLTQLAQIVNEDVHDADLEFEYSRVLVTCLIDSCVYDEAQTMVKKAIVLAPRDEDRATLEAQLAELHFLQGELDSAIHTASERGKIDD